MNHDQLSTFLSLMYPSDSCWIALCLIPPHARRRPEHRFTTVDRLRRFLGYARFRNAAGWGVYITPSVLKPNPRNRCKESFRNRQSVIYLDCDRSDCVKRIQQRYPYPTLVVKTSKGRYQVYWRLDQPVDSVQQEHLMSAMAADVHADQAATDVSRVLRVPGFWNRKPGRSNTVNIVFTRHHTVSYRSLFESAQPLSSRKISPTTSPSTGRDRRLVLVEPEAAERSSNRCLTESERDWYQVHRRIAFGQPPQDVVHWLQAKRADKPNPSYYAQLTVSKALEKRRHSSSESHSNPNP